MTTETTPLDEHAFNQLFRDARSQNKWLDKPVPDAMLEQLYDLMKWAPTSANSSPARLVFVRTAEGKARLKQALSGGNIEKTMTAPVTAIVATDYRFYDRLPELFPHTDARAWFTGNEELVKVTAFRNGTLQGAYLMMAARSLGLDIGAMSGFDNAKVDELFFGDTGWKSNFLVNIGYGDPTGLFARLPRLHFDDACRLE